MSNLVTSWTLKLEDQLTGGLSKLMEQVDRLRAVAESLEMPGLATASEQADKLGVSLSRIQRMAQGAGEALRNMGQAGVAAARSMWEDLQNIGGGLAHSVNRFGEAGSNLVNRGFGAAAEGFAIYEPIKKYAEFENILRHIGITEGLSGGALNARIGYLKEFIRADALKSVQTPESIATAYMELDQMGIRGPQLDTIIQAHSAAATAYNTTTEALGPAVGALIQTLKVPAAELSVALSAMAQASKEGRFKIEDFSRELPGVAAQMALLGMTGRKGADITFAALETVMRGSSNPSSAATGLTNVLEYIRSPFGQRAFHKSGINLDAILQEGLKKSHAGTGSVLDELIHNLADRTKGMNEVTKGEFLGKLFHNQTAGSAMLTLLQQLPAYLHLQEQLDKVDRGIVDRDVISAIAAPKKQMELMGITADIIGQRLGEGFLPVLKLVNYALYDLNSALEWANSNFPQTTKWVLAGTAAMFGLSAVLVLLGAILPLFTAGWGVLAAVLRPFVWTVGKFAGAIGWLLSAIGGIVGISGGAVAAIAILAGALTFAAIDIYEHWGKFRVFWADMVAGALQAFGSLGEYVRAIFTGDMEGAAAAVEKGWAGVEKFFVALFSAVKQAFVDFGAWVDSWTGGLVSRIGSAIGSSISDFHAAVHKIAPGGVVHDFDNSALGRMLGLEDKGAAKMAAAGATSGGALGAGVSRLDVHLHTDPGTTVGRTVSSNPAIVVQTPNRGGTVSRP